MRLKQHYTYREILNSLSPEKRKMDGTVSTLLHRPLSFPLSWLFLNCGWSPNAVTYLSIGLSLGALFLSFVPSLAFHVIALALYTAFGPLDCADGNMARTLRNRRQSDQLSQSPSVNYGEWVDALGGYAIYACILLSLGLSSMLVAGDRIPGLNITVPGGSTTWMLIAAVTCAANLFMRLAFQAFRVVSGEKSRAGIGAEKRLSEEIGVTGWFQILYLVGLLTGFLPWVLVFYAFLYCGGCAFTIVKLIVKVERYNRTAVPF